MIRSLSCLAVLAAGLSLAEPASAQHWKWTEPAAHHQSVVAVLAGNAGGTGVHIGNGWLLTAGHVAETASGYVTFPNGNRYAWRMARRHYRGDVDLAVLYSAECAHEAWARVASQPPQHGETVELVGLGGPGPNNDGRGKQYRHFAMTVLGETDETRLVTNGVVTFGDSGAPAFNSRGEVIAIQSAGRETIDLLVSSNGAKWNALTPALLTNVGPIRRLLGWTYQGGCYGGQCLPQQGYARQGGGNAQGWYPPQQPAPQQQAGQGAIPEPPAAPVPDGIAQTPPGQVSPSPPACDPACDAKCDELDQRLDDLQKAVDHLAANQVDDEKLAGILAGVLQADPERFRGPAGPQGPAGPPGEAAELDLSQVSQLVLDRLPPIHVQVLDDQGQPKGPPATVSLGGKLNLHHRIVTE